MINSWTGYWDGYQSTSSTPSATSATALINNMDSVEHTSGTLAHNTAISESILQNVTYTTLPNLPARQDRVSPEIIIYGRKIYKNMGGGTRQRISQQDEIRKTDNDSDVITEERCLVEKTNKTNSYHPLHREVYKHRNSTFAERPRRH